MSRDQMTDDDHQANAERKEFCLRTSRPDMKHGSQVDNPCLAIYNASNLNSVSPQFYFAQLALDIYNAQSKIVDISSKLSLPCYNSVLHN